MNLMNTFVAFQMDDLNVPLPPVDQQVAEMETRIAKKEERLAKIDAAVKAVLEQRSGASISALKKIIADIITDDPNGALRPQLENLRLAVIPILELYNETSKVVSQSNFELGQKTQQHTELEDLLKNLRNTLENGNKSQIRGFLKECADVGANYASNH